jgi:hypothetical protein
VSTLAEAIAERSEEGRRAFDEDDFRHGVGYLSGDEQAFLRRWADALVIPATNFKWHTITTKHVVHCADDVVRYAIVSLRDAQTDDETSADEGQRNYNRLVRMAEAADVIAEYFEHKETEIVRIKGTDWPILRELGPLEHLAALHRREADIFRRLAGPREPTPSLHIRGEQGRKDKRPREQDLFMQHMSHWMTYIFGKPRHSVVAEIANVAYARKDITDDVVKEACRHKERGRVGIRT